MEQSNSTVRKQDKPAGFYLKPNSIQKEVSFETEDGWTIYGTYTLPANYKEGEKLPAALLLHASMHSQTVWAAYPGWAKIQEIIPTLRIDIRGRGKSEGKIPYLDFTLSQREKVILDVKAALNFLCSQDEVDAARIGIAAEEFNAGVAIKGAMEDPRVRAFVLLSGLFDQQAVDLIAANLNKPILYVVSKEDKQSFNDMTLAYNSAENSGSEIWVEEGLGVGATMGSVWRNRYIGQPIEGHAIDYTTGEWLVKKLQSLGSVSEVTLETDDGWTLYANLCLPDNVKEGEKVPGVILLPTALADRTSYRNLERLLVGNNIAVLNLEWRGIGKSTGKNNYIDMTLSELIETPRDVQHGYKFLASHSKVDPERIGVLGAAFAAKLVLHAASQNPKLKAVAMLTPVTWPWEQDKDYADVASLDRPVFLVTGDGFGDLTHKFSEIVAQDERNTVLTYPGAIFGYLIHRIDADFERTIADWFKQHLNGAK